MSLDLVNYFIQVTQFGSFSKAAQSLGLPKSTLSKAVARLESEVGTKLLLRTTRNQTLTAAGRVFYEKCIGPIQTIEEARKSLSGNDDLLIGRIRLTSPEDLGIGVISPAIGKFVLKHTSVQFELIYTDTLVDLIRDGFDLAIRVGQLKESSLKSKRIGEIKQFLVATPDYVQNHPKIQNPEDLKNHPCLLHGGRISERIWKLSSSSQSCSVTVRPKIVSNQMSSLIQAALSDCGVAKVPAFLCKKYIEEGSLVQVLPKWQSHGTPVSILSPVSFSSSVRLRLITDYLADEIQKALK